MQLVGEEEERGGRGEVPAVDGVRDEDEGAVPECEDELDMQSGIPLGPDGLEGWMGSTSSRMSLWRRMPER